MFEHIGCFAYVAGDDQECPTLPHPANGIVKFTAGRGIGAKLWYVCNSGYRLEGSESRTCNSDLNWSGEAARCVGMSSTKSIHMSSDG